MSENLVTICIPTYEMGGRGAAFLKQSLDIMVGQTFKDFDVVISDHSRDSAIRDLCQQYSGSLRINYVRNASQIGNSPANTNYAMSKATGRLIKILFQDDFLFGSRALEMTASAFDLAKDAWLVTASEHTFDDGKTFRYPLQPRYHDRIHIGDNTISSPSVLTIRNEGHLWFDEALVLRVDCDFYKRSHDVFGEPKVLSDITVVNRVGPHQLSAKMNSEALKEHEHAYLLLKHNEPNWPLSLLRFATKRRINRLKRGIKRFLVGDEPRPLTSPHAELP